MTRHWHVVLAGAVVFAAAASVAAQSSPRPPLSSPTVVQPPTWWRVLQMPDGRTFVTDGGLSIDARLAKPSTLPSVVLPPVSAKTIAGFLAAPHERETGLVDVRPGSASNTFTTPDGVLLNGNYVAFLRGIASPARTRLRTTDRTRPVVIVVAGEAVGVMMPLQPPK